jgi:serine acetyltransferase
VGANSFLLTNLGPAVSVIGVPATQFSAADTEGAFDVRKKQAHNRTEGHSA